MLPFHVTLFLFTLFFRLHVFMVRFFPVPFFTTCSFFILSSLHVAYFFMLCFFHVTLLIFFSSFSPCWSFFMLHYFHIPLCYVVPFSYCISNSLHCSLHTFLKFSLIFCCLFHVTLSSCCLPVATFSCDTFWCYVFFMFHVFAVFIMYPFHVYTRFMLNSFQITLFYVVFFHVSFFHTTFFMFEINSFWTLPYCCTTVMFSFIWCHTHLGSTFSRFIFFRLHFVTFLTLCIVLYTLFSCLHTK